MLVNKEWLLTPERALLHLATATAIVADMHLGYCEARQAAGEAVPAVDLDETLSVFEHLHSRHQIVRLVVAGDLIENRAGLEIASRFHESLGEMGIDLIVVPGNHDRDLETVGLPFQQQITVAGWRISHGSGPFPRGRVIAGHYHPALQIGGRYLPCFFIGPRRMILPAFSQEAAGATVIFRRHGAMLGMRRSVDPATKWLSLRAVVIAGDRLVAVRLNGNKSDPVKVLPVSFQA